MSPLAAPFSFPEGKHGVLLIHGFTGSPAHMLPLGKALHEKGFAVEGILLPGHGTQPQDMGSVSWQDWLLAVRQAAQKMKGQYEHFSVAGLSMGGVLALLLAEEMHLTACVTLAAPMKTTNKFRALAPLLAPFYPTITKGEKGSRALLDAAYDIGYDQYPTVSVGHLSALIRRARQHLSLIRCPLLAVQSRKDEAVTADSPDIILNEISSQTKARLWLQDAPHVCTLSAEAPQIVSAMEAFLHKAEP